MLWNCVVICGMLLASPPLYTGYIKFNINKVKCILCVQWRAFVCWGDVLCELKAIKIKFDKKRKQEIN